MNVRSIDALAARSFDAEHFAAVDRRFPSRWSPRAMAGEALAIEQLHTLLEAARWAPSCYNAQPWRFAYALRGDEHWQRFLDLLVDGNRTWAAQAGALVAVAARNRYERNDQPAPTCRFDAGAAWMSLALQAQHMGLVAHGMWGFHHEEARRQLGVDEAHDLCAMVAIGFPGEVEALPEAVRAKETPSDRKPLDAICFAGGFR